MVPPPFNSHFPRDGISRANLPATGELRPTGETEEDLRPEAEGTGGEESAGGQPWFVEDVHIFMSTLD